MGTYYFRFRWRFDCPALVACSTLGLVLQKPGVEAWERGYQNVL